MTTRVVLLLCLLDAPAGNRGFVTVRPAGHFYFEDGTRARFFGTNVGGRVCAPTKEEATDRPSCMRWTRPASVETAPRPRVIPAYCC